MREILFRGKDETTKKWVYSDLLIQRFSKKYMIGQYEDNNYIWHIVIPETVGQYIGIDDIDGEKIFEGDILEFKIGAYKAHRNRTVKDVVVYENGCYKTQRYKMPLSAIICRIIGNRWDNPELLGGKDG